MFEIVKLLNKIIIVRFYERNAGFFLFVFLVMFGVVESSQILNYHLSLIGGMLGSGIFMSLVFLVWMAYSFKCVQFIHESLNNPKNAFLFSLRGVPKGIQFGVFVFLVFLLFLPIILYSLFIIGVAVVTQHWIELTITTVCLMSLISGSAWLAILKLNHSIKQFSFVNVPSINIPINKSVYAFYLSHLIRNRSIPVLLTKLFSLLTVIGFFHIQVDHYEVRIALLGLLIGLSAHAVIIFEMRRFEDESLRFIKNMPISIFTRFIHLLIVYAVLLAPELVLIGINHVKIIDCFLVWIFGVSILLFHHMNLYPIRMNMDRFIIRVLLFFLIAFMLVLFKVYVFLMIALLIFSFLIYRKWYFQFELPFS